MKKAFTLIELLIVVAIIAILAAIAVPNFLEAQTRAKVARVLSDQRTYATALETYMIDHSTYFPHYSDQMGAEKPTNVQENINEGLATAASNSDAASEWQEITTFASKPGTGGGANWVPPLSLTTPVSYLNTYVPDTFATFKQATFGYAAGPTFLMWSPGPDQVDQLYQSKAAEGIVYGGQSLPSEYLLAGPGNGTTAPDVPAGSSVPKPPDDGDAFTYDASNGTTSAGDVYRTK